MDNLPGLRCKILVKKNIIGQDEPNILSPSQPCDGAIRKLKRESVYIWYYCVRCGNLTISPETELYKKWDKEKKAKENNLGEDNGESTERTTETTGNNQRTEPENQDSGSTISNSSGQTSTNNTEETINSEQSSSESDEKGNQK